MFLNESQCFMLQNRGKHTILNEATLTEEEKNLEEIRYSKQKEKVLEYIKLKKQQNTLTLIDNLVINYVCDDLKEEIVS